MMYRRSHKKCIPSFSLPPCHSPSTPNYNSEAATFWVINKITSTIIIISAASRGIRIDKLPLSVQLCAKDTIFHRLWHKYQKSRLLIVWKVTQVSTMMIYGNMHIYRSVWCSWGWWVGAFTFIKRCSQKFNQRPRISAISEHYQTELVS